MYDVGPRDTKRRCGICYQIVNSITGKREHLNRYLRVSERILAMREPTRCRDREEGVILTAGGGRKVSGIQ